MSVSYRFFKNNIIGGFRLSDINKNVKQGDYFYIDSHVVETSKACFAALREKWMIEVSEKEAAKFVELPKVKVFVETAEKVSNKPVHLGVAIHNAATTNKSLESRQAAKTHKIGEAVATPKFAEAESNIRKRNNDKIDNDDSDRIKVIKSPTSKAAKKVPEGVKVIASLAKEDEDIKIADEILEVPKRQTTVELAKVDEVKKEEVEDSVSEETITEVEPQDNVVEEKAEVEKEPQDEISTSEVDVETENLKKEISKRGLRRRREEIKQEAE
jgi:hypothetical protein